MKLPAFLRRLKKLRLFSIRRVVGASMVPTLRPGAIIVAVPPHRLRHGDIVIVVHEGLEKIKRVADIQDDSVFVVGDNPTASTDSRQFGWLPLEAVVAKAIHF
ncbi:MAG TPA: S26 family signal peptidase [Candidatus Saccharimonadales bacterium]|nr:S26 family signal peptidase [Candidatus Saccharimonadales bacterium]